MDKSIFFAEIFRKWKQINKLVKGLKLHDRLQPLLQGILIEKIWINVPKQIWRWWEGLWIQLQRYHVLWNQMQAKMYK